MAERRVWRLTPLIAVLVTAAVILGGVAWWQLRTAQPSPSPPPSPSPTIGPTQSPTPEPSPPDPSPTPDGAHRVLLVQVRDDEDLAVCNVVMGVGGADARAAFVSAPPGLLVDTGADGEMVLARTVTLPDTLAAQNSLANQLGLRIDGALTMDRLAFAGLVDAVNGVAVPGPTGVVQLSGAEASVYVTERGPLEDESDRMTRCREVWMSVVRALPSDEARLRQVVISLGALARITVPVDFVVATLLAGQSELRADRFVEADVPRALVRPGDPEVFIAEQPATSRLLEQVLVEAVLIPGTYEPRRVSVISATADVVSVLEVRERLVGAGFAVVLETPMKQQRSTRIAVPSEELLPAGIAAAEALGLDPAAVRVRTLRDSTVDVQVVVGAARTP